MDIHPSFDDTLALEIVDILRDAGASLDHTMISHMEVFDFALDTRVKLLAPAATRLRQFRQSRLPAYVSGPRC